MQHIDTDEYMSLCFISLIHCQFIAELREYHDVSVGLQNLPSQNMSLGHVDYLRLILFKKQEAQG